MPVLIRLFRINVAHWGYLLWWSLSRSGMLRSGISPAQRFVATLERLGTTFVKLGQGLALHRELLPDQYVAALGKLHDRVEPFPGDLAKTEIEASFGRPLAELFAEFDAQPFAAGSIAQVHRARLHDGQTVIVKVRRPGIKHQLEEDIRISRWFVKSVLWGWPTARRVQPLELIDELACNLRREIDFRQEAANIARFVEVFRDSPTVYVPGVIGELYSEWVIVQEMSPGWRIDDPKSQAHGPELAKHLVDAYLHQLFVVGIFHGDPHPGNLFVLEDGRICFHDFGLVGFLDRATRTNLIAFMLAFVQQDGDWLLDAYLDLGMLGGKPDRAEFRAEMEELIQDYARKPLKDWSFGEVFLRIAQMGQGRSTRIPHHLLVLLRAIFLMESTLRRLDPHFNLIEGLFAQAGRMLEAIEGTSAAAEAVGRLQYESLVSLRQLPGRLGQALHRIRSQGVELPITHQGLGPLQEEIRRSSARVSLALVTLGLYIAASLLMQHSLGPRWGNTPVLAVAGYVLALWLTWRLVRDVCRRDGS